MKTSLKGWAPRIQKLCVCKFNAGKQRAVPSHRFFCLWLVSQFSSTYTENFTRRLGVHTLYSKSDCHTRFLGFFTFTSRRRVQKHGQLKHAFWRLKLLKYCASWSFPCSFTYYKPCKNMNHYNRSGVNFRHWIILLIFNFAIQTELPWKQSMGQQNIAFTSFYLIIHYTCVCYNKVSL